MTVLNQLTGALRIAGVWGVATVCAIAQTPGAYDLNEYQLVTPVKNQGALGTCWAFASTTAFQSGLLKAGLVSSPMAPEIKVSSWHLATANGNVTDLTPNAKGKYDGWGGFNEYAVGYWTRGRGQWLLKPDAGTTPAGGGAVMTANNPLNVYPFNEALDKENLDPYVAPPSQQLAPYTLKQSVSLIWDKNPATLGAYQQDLKDAIVKYGGLAVYLHVFQDSPPYDFEDTQNPYVFYQPADSPYQSNHAVALVGWDDNVVLRYFDQEFIGGWLIQNSWGVDFGTTDAYSLEGGYYWIPFADASMANLKEAQAFVPQRNVHTPTNIPYGPTMIQNQIFSPYIEEGPIRVGYGVGEVTIAAEKLRVPSNSAIGAIGLWQGEAGTKLELQIYSQWEDGPVGPGLLSSPMARTLNEDGSGYNLLELDQPLFLAEGGDVYVVVDFGDEHDSPIVIDTRTARFLLLDPESYTNLSWILNTSTGEWNDLALADFGDLDDDETAIFFMKMLRLNLDLDNANALYPIDASQDFTVDGLVQTARNGSANTILGLNFYDGGILNLNGPLTVAGGIFNVGQFYETGAIQGASHVIVPNDFSKTGEGTLELYSDLAVGGNASILAGTLKIFEQMVVGDSFYIDGTGAMATVESGGVLYVANQTQVLEGTLNVGGTLNTPVLEVSEGLFEVYAGGVLHAESMNLSGGGTLFSGDQTVLGSATVGEGAELTVFPGGSLQAGEVEIAGGTVQISSGATVSSAGQATMNGGGALEIDGLLTTPMLMINSGSLTGSGLIAGNVTNAGGWISPGNSPGTLTINGNYTQGSSGTFLMDIADAQTFDRLLVQGTASLAGALVVAPGSGTVLVVGQTFDDFLQAESVEGRFESVLMPQGLRGRILEENGDLSLLVAPASYSQFAVTKNQENAAKALDSFISATSGDRETVSTALDHLSAEEYPAALDAVSPAFYATLSSMNIELIFNQGQQMQQRFRSLQLGIGGLSLMNVDGPVLSEKSTTSGKETKDILVPSADNNWGVWLQGNGIFSNQASVNNIPGYQSNSGGFLGGADYRWNEAFATGIYAGYQGAFAEYNDGGRTVLNGVRFGGYAAYGKSTGFFANAMVGGGYTSYSVNRPISFGSIERTARSAPGGGDFETLLNLGYNWQLGNFNFGPVASAQYTYLGIGSFTENGADSLNLRVDQQNANSLRTLFGGQVAYIWKISPNWAVIPQGSIYWQHEFLQNPQNIGSSLNSGNGPAFGYETAAPARDSVYAGAGLTVQLGERWNTNFYYNANFGRQDYISHQITGGVGFQF